MRNKSINGKFLRTRRMTLTNSFVCSCFIYHNLSKHCLIPNMFWYGFAWMRYLSAIKALSIDILADTKKDRSRVKTLLLRRSIIYFLVPAWHQQVSAWSQFFPAFLTYYSICRDFSALTHSHCSYSDIRINYPFQFSLLLSFYLLYCIFETKITHILIHLFRQDFTCCLNLFIGQFACFENSPSMFLSDIICIHIV